MNDKNPNNIIRDYTRDREKLLADLTFDEIIKGSLAAEALLESEKNAINKTDNSDSK